MSWFVEIEGEIINAGEIDNIYWEYTDKKAYSLIIKQRNGRKIIYDGKTLEQIKKLRNEIREKINY